MHSKINTLFFFYKKAAISIYTNAEAKKMKEVLLSMSQREL